MGGVAILQMRNHNTRTVRSLRELFLYLADAEPKRPFDIIAEETPQSWRLRLLRRVIPSSGRWQDTDALTSKMKIMNGTTGVGGGVAESKDGPPTVWATKGLGTVYEEIKNGRGSDVPTIIMVETDRGSGHWMEPSDLAVEDLVSRPVRLRSIIPSTLFFKLTQSNGIPIEEREQIILPYRLDTFGPLQRGSTLTREGKTTGTAHVRPERYGGR
jgi:hypothetical protein